MERVRRRYWTWAVTLFAGTVIFAAAVSGVFQLAVLALPSYREEISAWVTRVADRPVDIGGIGLVWRGVYPRLDLTDITLYDEDGSEALTADRVSLGFSSARLLLGELIPTRIELNGLSLAADIDEEGRLSVAGFDALGGEAFPKNDRLMKQLRRFQRIRLSNCEVRFTHAALGRSPLEFTLTAGEIDRTRSGFDAEADIKLPPAYGERVELAASVDGDVADPRSWSGDFSAEVLRLAPQAWLRNWLVQGAQFQARDLNLHAEGELGAGRLQKMQLRAESEAFVVARAGRAWQGQELQAEATVTAEGEGWRIQIGKFEQDEQPLLAGQLRYRRLADSGYELDADIDDLQLGRITPWLAYLRVSPQLRRAAGLGGELDALVLRLRQTAEGLHYSLRSDFREIALNGDAALGLRHFNGQFTATEKEGRLKLAGTPVELRLPRLFDTALPFEALSAELQWQRTASGWTLRAPDFGWRLAGSKGSGRLELQLPEAEGASPVMDLAARFSAEDATALKPWIPLQWGEHTREWLQRAIRAGRAPKAELAIRGALRDFPYTRPGTEGEWKLDIDVSGADLAYAPDWPAVEDIEGRLSFRGNGLSVDADSGKVSGNRIDGARADIADFHEAQLTIDGEVSGETSRFYDFLRNSPLRKQLAGLVNRTRAAGPARVDVHLDIPLHHADATEVAGRVALDGVQLFYEGLEQPVDDIRGELSFTGHGLEAEHLDARFSDLVLNARIEARPKSAGLVVVEFPFAPKATGGGVSDYIPGFVRGQLTGESRWRAELPLDGSDAGLVLSSDLRGTAVQLPPPMGKLASETAPIRLSFGSDSAPLRIRLDYGQRLGADIAYAREGQALKPRAAQLKLGGGMPAAPAADARGMVVSGELPEMDIGLWAGLLSTSGDGAADAGGLALREVDLSATRWLLDDSIIPASRLRWSPTPEGWRADLSGDGAEGELRYARAGQLNARLKRLSLQSRPPPAIAAGVTPEGPARDPREWPVLDIDCQRLLAGELELGHLQLRSSRVSDGQRLDKLSISGGKLDLDASGIWQRNAAGSSAALKFELGSSDAAGVLQALGYSPTLTAQSSKFNGELNWTPAPRLNWQQASGSIRLDVEKGTLKAVEPGAGRVLGLLNLYAIPRRLLLDFRDVASAGLGFDKLAGNFQLGEGQARTSDMELSSPSLRMEIRGRIGLVARDLDQQVKVYPDMSSGVTLGAALLGGPAVGALVLVAQQVLDKPIEQVTQLSYRVTGGWDNPRVDRGN